MKTEKLYYRLKQQWFIGHSAIFGLRQAVFS
jgi:hypothetical protein